MLGGDPVIFVSVGSMLPFDRLVMAADDWAKANPDDPVFIQIGEGAYEPKQAPWVRIMPHGEYLQRMPPSASIPPTTSCTPRPASRTRRA
jgi:hypothetical protein